MAKMETFTISSSGKDKVEVNKLLPENLDDPQWDEIVSDRDDINDLALGAWKVRCQAGARQRLDAGPEAVQQYVDGYVFGARSPGFAPSVSAADAKKQNFSDEQLAFLKAAGVKIEADAA